jgi:hypothetical protein
MDVGGTWGADGPPSEAYGRVTRDLAAVTAAFAAYLDELPTRLVREYDCELRDPTAEEIDRLPHSSSTEFDETHAVQPRRSDCAVLVLARSRDEGGAMVRIGFGVASSALIPGCFCDACDEDSESLIEQTDEFVHVAVEGCREYRRPYTPKPGMELHTGPWMQVGYEWRGGGSASAGPSVRGESFSQQWQAWPHRVAPD